MHTQRESERETLLLQRFFLFLFLSRSLSEKKRTFDSIPGVVKSCFQCCWTNKDPVGKSPRLLLGCIYIPESILVHIFSPSENLGRGWKRNPQKIGHPFKEALHLYHVPADESEANAMCFLREGMQGEKQTAMIVLRGGCWKCGTMYLQKSDCKHCLQLFHITFWYSILVLHLFSYERICY